MSNGLNEILDEDGFIHRFDISNILGAGGQGRVFETTSKNVLLKLIQTKDRKITNREINRVMALNIPEICKVAKPIAKIMSEYDMVAGYTMRMMEDMEPISVLMEADEKKVNKYYISGGSLKRRLLLLKKIAYNLFLLHGENIVYGDISENNIFISENIQKNEVWLIDCDNMAYSQDVKWTVLTKGYGAPEIYNNSEVNTLSSDVYAFGVLSFRVLALCDPFTGSALEEEKINSEDEFKDETKIQKEIYQGNIPWVGEINSKNKPLYGYSTHLDKLLTKNLKHLFERTFGEIGRKNREERPTMKEWYYSLSEAYNATITCDVCGWTYYPETGDCPICQEKKKSYYQIEIFEKITLGEISLKKNMKTLIREIQGDEFKVEKNELYEKFIDLDEIGLRFYCRNKKFFLENNIYESMSITDSDNCTYYVRKNKSIDVLNFKNLKIEVESKDEAVKKIEIKITEKGNI